MTAPDAADFGTDPAPDAGQTEAWEAVVARLAHHGVDLRESRILRSRKSGKAADALAVAGKAGSGKTALLAKAAQALAACGLAQVTPDWEPSKRSARRSFAVLAPTNKAASVLRGRGVQAATIHRILYTPVYDPEFEKLIEWLQGERAAKPAADGLKKPGLTAEALDRAKTAFEGHGSVPGALAGMGIRGADFITGWDRREDPLDIALVDEASMIDGRQMEDLSKIFSLTILFGDPAQLAPVNAGEAAEGGMPFAALPGNRVFNLGRIHRQTADNPILDLAHCLGESGVDFETFEARVRAAAARDDRVQLRDRADAELMCESPVLVWRNKTRVRLIDAFRTAHLIDPDRLAPGEPLICDGLELPRKQRGKRIDLEARGLIKGAQARYLGEGKRPGFARIDLLDTEEPGISVAAIIQIESPNEDEPRLVSAARAGALFLHGAAATIHKAQGSQWPQVQVFAPDLWIAARSNRMEAGAALWRRLAYVAVTRAEERLIWVRRSAVSRPAVPLGGRE